MKLAIGRELVRNGYKRETFFFEDKIKRTTYLYEYSIFMERVDTFKFTNKSKLESFKKSMIDQGYKIINW